MTLLAYHASESLHAIGLTLIRLAFTKRRLLEWETAAAVAARITGISSRTGLGRRGRRAGNRQQLREPRKLLVLGHLADNALGPQIR